jgi:hypothetical protein
MNKYIIFAAILDPRYWIVSSFSIYSCWCLSFIVWLVMYSNFSCLIIYARTKESHFFKDLIEDTYGSIKGNVILAATHKEFGLLFVEYKKLYGTPATTVEIRPPSETSQNSSESSVMRARYNKRMRLSGGDGSTNSKSELDKYLAEDTEEASPRSFLVEVQCSSLCRSFKIGTRYTCNPHLNCCFWICF